MSQFKPYFCYEKNNYILPLRVLAPFPSNQIIGNFQFACCKSNGKSLLAKSYILSIFSSCLQEGPLAFATPDDFDVVLAEHDWTDDDDGQIRAEVDVRVTHPSRSDDGDSRDYDYALIRTKDPIVFSTVVRPVCLPRFSSARLSYTGFVTTVAGWGRTEDDRLPQVLSKLDVQVRKTCQRSGAMRLLFEHRIRTKYFPDSGKKRTANSFLESSSFQLFLLAVDNTCRTFSSSIPGLTSQIIDSSSGTCGSYPAGSVSPRQMCAFLPDPKRPGDACQGDSGGPLFGIASAFGTRNTILGVVSFGRGCGTPG